MVSAKKLSLSVTNVIKNLNINLPSPDILSLFTNKRNFNVIFANTTQQQHLKKHKQSIHDGIKFPC